ncbi:retrovirus-related pol polyprotein from transposon TNT 1-94 [Tanacetum coccineum]|uniref:Retrovirus-related pol polyprotein from transposon TNT 1-94 n=1 Tax=Tanacetum coccineum TaxID=301880 RepID=A0ABQ5GRT3_9ASTR
MLKNVTNKSFSSRSKGVESNVSNNTKPSQNWGSNVSTAPSPSLVDIRFGNDQIKNIIGYGDDQMGNDEAPEFVIKFLKMIQVHLNATVQNIRTGILLSLHIKHPLLSLHNRTAEAVAIACYTQNRSLICKRHNKTPYELLHNRKPDLSYLHVFGALCYPTNDSEDLGKLKPKADIGIFVGYALAKKAYRIYNKRTRYVDFDEIQAMASE